MIAIFSRNNKAKINKNDSIKFPEYNMIEVIKLKFELFKTPFAILGTVLLIASVILLFFYFWYGAKEFIRVINSDSYLYGIFINMSSSILDYIIFVIIIALVQQLISNNNRKRLLHAQIENNRSVEKIEASSLTIACINELRNYGIMDFNLERCYLEDNYIKGYFKSIEFANASMKEIRFIDASIKRLRFKSSKAFNVRFSNVLVYEGDINNTEFYNQIGGKNTFFKSVIFDNVKFINCDLSKINFQFCTMKSVEFNSCNLTNTKFHYCYTTNMKIRKCILNRTEFLYCSGFSKENVSESGEKGKNTCIIKGINLSQVEQEEIKKSS